MKKILAISGGLDSVCLLHMMREDPGVVVAHFNHGTRLSAGDDERFVRGLAERYGLPICVGREDLGEDCSEELARERRYAFLNRVAKIEDGVVYTAHHQDDLVESVVINLYRGTGWRGLVPLGDLAVRRPLLGFSKKELYGYAVEHGLVFRQDPTNTEDRYLRNRIRRVIFEYQAMIDNEVGVGSAMPKNEKNTRPTVGGTLIMGIADLYKSQKRLRKLIDQEPQLTEFLMAVRAYGTGKQFNLPGGRLVVMGRDSFVI